MQVGNQRSVQCVICGRRLTHGYGIPAYETPCPDCGYVPWCSKRESMGRVRLTLLRGQMPGEADIERLASLLVASDSTTGVILDLSELETIDSLLLARLVSLNRRIQPAKGRVAVCGLSPVVRETFRRTHLDSLLDVLDGGSNSGSAFGDDPTNPVEFSIA